MRKGIVKGRIVTETGSRKGIVGDAIYGDCRSRQLR
jgi:hypothetical protein